MKNLGILVLLVLLVFAGSAHASLAGLEAAAGLGPISASPLVYYDFDEAAGTTASSTGTLNNDMALNNMDFVTDGIGGADGGALQFNGTTQYGQNTMASAPGTPFSQAMWIKPDVTMDDSQPFVFLAWNTDNGIGMFWDTKTGVNQGVYGQFKAALSPWPTQSVWDWSHQELAADQWIHIAHTYDGVENYKLYVDGDLVQHSLISTYPVPSGTISQGLANMTIGAQYGADNFAGGMDEFGYWEAELTQRDIDILSIPEPATMMLLGLGGLALIRRRRN